MNRYSSVQRFSKWPFKRGHCFREGRIFPALTAVVLWLGMGALPVQAQEICAYTAKISANDKINHAGRNIMATVSKQAALAVIRMDRSNFYRYNKRDAEDESDCRFSDLAERQKLDTMSATSTIAPALIRKLEHGEPLLRIKVFADRLEIAEAAPADSSREKAAVSRKEPQSVAEQKPSMSPEAMQAAPVQVTPVQVTPVQLTPAQAIPPVQAPPTQTALVPAPAPASLLLGHEKTAEAMNKLQKDTGRQKILQKWIGVPDYAECSVMLADIDRKVGSRQHHLTAQQWDVYPDVAANMAYAKQQFLASGVAAAEIDKAVRAVESRLQSLGIQSVYDQCYKAMRPVYEETSARK